MVLIFQNKFATEISHTIGDKLISDRR